MPNGLIDRSRGLFEKNGFNRPAFFIICKIGYETTQWSATMMMTRKIFFLFQLAFWTIYFAYTVFVTHYSSFIQSEYSPLIPILYLFLLCFFGIPLTTLASRLYQRVHFQQRSISSMGLIVILISAILAHVWVLEIYLLDKLFNALVVMLQVKTITFIPLKARVYLWEVFVAGLLLLTWSSIYLFMELWQAWHQQQFEIKNARLQLENARLRILSAQIRPHFLFNSLSSLRALIRDDSQRAEVMLSKIADFLRYALEKKSMQEVLLSDEVEAMKTYLAIEQVRFMDKLHIQYSIEESAARQPVPAFLLHPLVENAVKYGLAGAAPPLSLELNARMIGDRLEIEVINSGRWRQPEVDSERTGTGLANVRERLEAMYPGRAALHVNAEEARVRVTVSIQAQ